MTPDLHDFDELRNRILNLEKENRRLKQFGVLTMIGITLLLLMGQAPSKKTVEANEFVLRDSGGNARATLGMDRDTPNLALYKANGKNVLRLWDGGVGELEMFDTEGAERASFSAGGLRLLNPMQQERTQMSSGHIALSDDNGFSAIVGTGDLVTPTTGETHRTSAASLILTDKNQNVIWKAP